MVFLLLNELVRLHDGEFSSAQDSSVTFPKVIATGNGVKLVAEVEEALVDDEGKVEGVAKLGTTSI